MKKRFVAAGLLAGGVALTVVAGSAYGEGGTSTGKTTHPETSTGHVIVSCTGPGASAKGKAEKGVVTMKENGKLRQAPPAGRKTGGKITLKGDGPGTVKVGSAPKGVHCSTSKPGTLSPSTPGR
jgi:hypothetical protein